MLRTVISKKSRQYSTDDSVTESMTDATVPTGVSKTKRKKSQSVLESIDVADPIEQLRTCDNLYKQLLEANDDKTINTLRKKIADLLRLMAFASKKVEFLMPKGDDPFDTNPDDIPEVKKSDSYGVVR